MAYLVGTDEAGYGPNLGPLVIAGTLWSTPEVRDADSLYDQLPGVVAPGKRASAVGSSLVLGDSKALYQPKGGLAALERGVFAALSALPNALQPDALQPDAPQPDAPQPDAPHALERQPTGPGARSWNAVTPALASRWGRFPGIPTATAVYRLMPITPRSIRPASCCEKRCKSLTFSCWTFEL